MEILEEREIRLIQISDYRNRWCEMIKKNTPIKSGGRR
jgi:hypothetical protein